MSWLRAYRSIPGFSEQITAQAPAPWVSMGKTVDEMAAHMAKHGQMEDIVLYGTEIVDGRTRQEAGRHQAALPAMGQSARGM